MYTHSQTQKMNIWYTGVDLNVKNQVKQCNVDLLIHYSFIHCVILLSQTLNEYSYGHEYMLLQTVTFKNSNLIHYTN